MIGDREVQLRLEAFGLLTACCPDGFLDINDDPIAFSRFNLHRAVDIVDLNNPSGHDLGFEVV